MEVFRKVYENVANHLQIDLPDALQHRSLEVIIFCREATTPKEALANFLASKDTEALADLDTDFFSAGRKIL